MISQTLSQAFSLRIFHINQILFEIVLSKLANTTTTSTYTSHLAPPRRISIPPPPHTATAEPELIDSGSDPNEIRSGQVTGMDSSPSRTARSIYPGISKLVAILYVAVARIPPAHTNQPLLTSSSRIQLPYTTTPCFPRCFHKPGNQSPDTLHSQCPTIDTPT